MSEDKAIKTCGECRYYFEQADFCCKNDWACIEEDKECCEDFKLPTNRDKLRQMSDEELATAWSNDAFIFAWCADCPRYCREYESEKTKQQCKQQMLSWLKKEWKG